MRCSKCWWAAAMLGIAVSGQVTFVRAQSALPETTLRDEAVSVEERALKASRPPWLMEQQGAVAEWSARWRELGTEAVMSPALTPLSSESARVDRSGRSQTVTILVSRSLGEAQLRELFAQAAGRPDVRIVFRGVASGESLGAFIRGIHTLLSQVQETISPDTVPNVEIDPRPFQTPLVEVAPTLILTDGAGAEIARVSGISRPDWLLEQVGQGRRGDLGVRGPTVAISEPDMIAELQRRLSRIDWSVRREAALARYWARAELAELPTAETARERRLDLTLVAQADVTLPNGSTVIQAGERVDPLAVLPFRQRLFVFDATDARQVAEVARLGAASRAEGRQPLYLATRLDRAAGWDGYRAVQAALQDPLYLLTPDVQRRFQIERVPAVVESRDGSLLVAEWPPGD